MHVWPTSSERTDGPMGAFRQGPAACPRSSPRPSQRSPCGTILPGRGCVPGSEPTEASPSATCAPTGRPPPHSPRWRSLRQRRRRRRSASPCAHRSLQPPGSTDAEARSGWGWTTDARSTVEPTSRVLAAVHVLTPADYAIRAEAIRLLRERQCADGGWNYGNASVNDVDLRGYAQTTAIALAALQRGTAVARRPGHRVPAPELAREPGGLTTAQAVVAFRLHGVEDEVGPALAALEQISRRPSFRGDPVALAWAVLASGPDALLAPLRSRA